MRARLYLTMTCVLVGTGCATVPLQQEAPPLRPQPPGMIEPAVPVPAVRPRPQEAAMVPPPAEAQRLQRLSLADALALAERLHPEFAIGQAQIERAEGRALQAGLLPNPELMLRLEAAPLTSRLVQQAEYVIGVSQAVPLGNRLTLARRVELLERDRASHALAGKRVEIRMRVQSAFATALYWQRVTEAREEEVRSAAHGVTLAQARLRSGDVIRAEVDQAEVELRRAELERQKARGNEAQARTALAATLGDAFLEIGSLDGALEGPLAVPELAALIARLEEGPGVAAAAAERAVQRAQLDLVQAQRTPDVNIDLVYRRLGESENAFDVGVRLPLRLFDYGQGRRQETLAELSAAEGRARLLRNELLLHVQTAHRKLTHAVAAATLLREEMLPRADRIWLAAESRYRSGDMSLSELLPLRRERTRVQLDYLDALHEVMQAWAELSPYSGSP